MASLAVSNAGTVGPPQPERCVFAGFSGRRGNAAFNAGSYRFNGRYTRKATYIWCI